MTEQKDISPFAGRRMQVTCMCACMQTCLHVCIDACMYTYIYISRCVYTCKCVCFCTHGCMFVCLPARVYLCMQESKNTWIMNHGVCCVCIYICIHTYYICLAVCMWTLINKWGRINRITNYLGRFCRSPARKTTSLQPGPDAQTIKWGRNDKKKCRMASLF